MKLLLILMLLPSICLANGVCQKISNNNKRLAMLENYKTSKQLCDVIYKSIDICKNDKVVLEIIKTAEITGCI